METGGIAGDRLRSFVERYERLQEEIDALNADRAELIKELAGVGFDKKVFKIIIKRRRMGKDACDEEDTLVEVYERALESGSTASRAPAREDEPAEPAAA